MIDLSTFSKGIVCCSFSQALDRNNQKLEKFVKNIKQKIQLFDVDNEPDVDCQVVENADRQSQTGLKRKGEAVELRTSKKSMQTRSISKGREIPSHLKSIRPNSLEGRDERINKVRSVTKSVGLKLKKHIGT